MNYELVPFSYEFRIWTTDFNWQKKMLYSGDEGYNKTMNRITTYGLREGEFLMLWPGWLDEKKKKIYTGDILKYCDLLS